MSDEKHPNEPQQSPIHPNDTPDAEADGVDVASHSEEERQAEPHEARPVTSDEDGKGGEDVERAEEAGAEPDDNEDIEADEDTASEDDDEEEEDEGESGQRPAGHDGAKGVSDKPYWMRTEQEQEDVPPRIHPLPVSPSDATLVGPATFAFYAFLLVALASALRIWLGSRIGLGDAEAYYWAWAQHLSLSYYDHPPAIAYLIHLGTLWLGDGLLGVRILSIAAIGLATLLVYDLGSSLSRDRRVGLLAALLFTVTPVYFVGGAAAAPDPALGFFWLLAVWLFHRALARTCRLSLLGVGVAVGLGLLTKYFMVLFWPAALLYLLLSRHRHWFGSVWLWAAVLVSLAIFSPVLIWNATNGWASFAYHLVERHSAAGFDSTRFWLFAGSQALYLSPLIALGLGLAVLALLRDVLTGKDGRGLPAAFCVPVLVFFLLLGAWTPQAEPHWPLIAYLLLFAVLAEAVLRLSSRPVGYRTALMTTGPIALLGRPGWRGIVLGWLVVPALLLNFALLLHLKTDVGFAFLPDDDRYNPALDLSNELRGWPEVGTRSASLLNLMADDAFVASYHYTMCGQLAFATRSLGRQVACLSPRTSAFDFFPSAAPLEGRQALLVTDSRYSRNPVEWANCTGGIHELGSIQVERAARVVRRFNFWRCDGYTTGPLAAGVPDVSPPVEPEPIAVPEPEPEPEPEAKPEPESAQEPEQIPVLDVPSEFLVPLPDPSQPLVTPDEPHDSPMPPPELPRVMEL